MLTRRIAPALVLVVAACHPVGSPSSRPSSPSGTSRPGSYVYPGSEDLVVHYTCAARPETKQACLTFASIVLGSAYPAAVGSAENVKTSTVRVRLDGHVVYEGEFHERFSAQSTFDTAVENLRQFYGLQPRHLDRIKLVATLAGTTRGYAVEARIVAREVKTAQGRHAYMRMTMVSRDSI